jgi:hypothetical protein
VAGVAYAVREIVEAMRAVGARRAAGAGLDWQKVGLICFIVILLLGMVNLGAKVSKAYGKGLRVAVDRSLAAAPHLELADILRPLRGKVVMTNIFPSVVSFFTRETALGGCELEAFLGSGPLNQLVNGALEAWTDVDARPDGWSLLGDGLMLQREATDARKSTASWRLRTPQGKAALFSQQITLPLQPERYRIVATFWVKTTSSRRVRAFLRGTGATFGAFHPGHGRWERLSIEGTFPANIVTAPVFEAGVRVEPGATATVNIHSASLYVFSLNATQYGNPIQLVAGPPSGSDGLVPGRLQDARPERADPSKCHAVWIRTRGDDGIPRPSHYVLFRGLFTGFTLCREAACLDRMENYIASRFPRVFSNELCTVFALDEIDRSGEMR